MITRPLLSRRGIHFIATRFGWPRLRAAAFSAKYKAGDWRNAPDPSLASLVAKHGGGGDILMMGCGSAAIAESVAFRSIVGIDLSEDVIAQAQARKTVNALFVVGDMEDYMPTESKDLIVFNESLYYVPSKRIVKFLSGLRRHLRPGGVFIATFARPDQWADVIAVIAANFTVVKQIHIGSSRRIALVFS